MKLEPGNVIELRNGYKFLYHCYGGAFSLDGKLTCPDLSKAFDENYENIDPSGDYDIIRIYTDYTLTTVIWKRDDEPRLTEDEKAILRNIDKKYKWIARDKNNMLYVYQNKPYKGKTSWHEYHYIVKGLDVFTDLFKFITWEDEEPYLISDLLEVEN